MIGGVPWRFSEINENPDGEKLPEVVRVQSGAPLKEEEKSAALSKTPIPVGFKISRGELGQFGYSAGCK